MGICQLAEDVACDVGPQSCGILPHEPVTQANHVVADVDCRGQPVPTMQGRLSVTKVVVVFDVVVNQRGLVERLDREGHAPHGIGDLGQMLGTRCLRGFATGHRIVGCQRDKWSGVLAAECQEVVGDGLGSCDGIETRGSLTVEFRQTGAASKSRCQPL